MSGGSRREQTSLDAIDERTPIEDVALAVARCVRRDVDVERVRVRLDELADSLAQSFDSSGGAAHCANQLAEHLHERWGFVGDKADYEEPRNSYLDEVIERRVGIPITLSVIYMAVGARLGVDVVGIGFPGRFLVRVGGEGGVFQDPYEGGALLDQRGLDELARRYAGRATATPTQLVASTKRQLAARMLANLERSFTKRGDRTNALIVTDSLVALTEDAARRRDRGLHAFALGMYGAAIDDLEAYVRARPTAADRMRVETMLVTARAKGGSRRN